MASFSSKEGYKAFDDAVPACQSSGDSVVFSFTDMLGGFSAYFT
jgi:hypothetical protein